MTEKKKNFIEMMAPYVREAGARTGLDPRLILAQSALETGWGGKAPGHNYFGIKSHSREGGQDFMTTEYIRGVPVKKTQNFREYSGPEESSRDYANFILENPRYKEAMSAKDMDAQIKAIGRSSYATDPKYGQKLRSIALGIELPPEQQPEDRPVAEEQRLVEQREQAQPTEQPPPPEQEAEAVNYNQIDPRDEPVAFADGGTVVEKYHGTDVNNITAFDPSKSRTAKYHYLADQPETARNYGEHVYSVKLKPKNMISFHPENIGPKQSKVVNELAERLGEDPEYLMNAITSADGSFYGARGSLQDNVMDELKDMGYDAVRFPDVAHGGSWDMSTVVLDNNIVDNIEKHAGEPAKADGGSVDDEDEGLTAYHGSPYDFEKFDTSKIGTGEGAQAYGHGLYFAESEPVAKEYRDKLTAGTYKGDTGQVFDPFRNLEHLNVRNAAYKSIDNAIDRAKGLLEDEDQSYNADMINRDLAKLMDAKAQNAQPQTGRMYEVRINAHPDHFLDWDTPLNQQSEHVQNAIKSIASSVDVDPFEHLALAASIGKHPRSQDYSPRGNDLYADLEEIVGDRTKLSNLLHQQGLKGIRYLDAGSRFSGKGSRNYVVFNHDHVQVKRKYAQGGAIDET